MRPKMIDQYWEEAWKAKLIHPDFLDEAVQGIRSRKHTIATLNGSFDLMHAGHLFIIYEASKVADRLIIALNSDASIKKYKGADRPIVPLEYRLQLMAALEWVDYVTWFDEADPLALLEIIKPDIHVNGAEYGENCIEAETVRRCGGKLHIVPRIPGLATSELLDKIQQLPSTK